MYNYTHLLLASDFIEEQTETFIHSTFNISKLGHRELCRVSTIIITKKAYINILKVKYTLKRTFEMHSVLPYYVMWVMRSNLFIIFLARCLNSMLLLLVLVLQWFKIEVVKRCDTFIGLFHINCAPKFCLLFNCLFVCLFLFFDKNLLFVSSKFHSGTENSTLSE